MTEYPNITLDKYSNLVGDWVLVLKDSKSEITTTYRIDERRMMVVSGSPMETLRLDLISWVKDFCRFAYTEENYVLGLITASLRPSFVEQSRVARTPPSPPPTPSSAPIPQREPKRAKLPMVRVIKL